MAHILVIDDDPAIQNVFMQFIEHLGHRATFAQNGREGLKHLKESHPDLLITDIMMPEMDGLEVVNYIREQKLKLPVIAISGGMKTAPVNFLPIAEKLGACRIFEKPVELTALQDAIEELLAGSSND